MRCSRRRRSRRNPGWSTSAQGAPCTARCSSRWRSSAPAPGARRSPFSARARDIRRVCGGATLRCVEAMRRARRNARYLPDAEFPAEPRAGGGSRRGARGGARCARRRALARLSRHARPHRAAARRPARALPGPARASRSSTGLLPHQVAREVFGPRPGAVLSGPTFAREVGAGLPTAMTVASRDADFAKELALRLSGPEFRAYTQSDIIGVEVGGAVKNVIAIGSGIADGMGFGANTRVALITRGLAEMTALGAEARRAARDLHGSRGARRSRAHLHRRSIAQPPLRAGARPRPVARRRLSGRSIKWSRASPPPPPCAKSPSASESTCRSASRCIGSCTRAGRCAPRCTR